MHFSVSQIIFLGDTIYQLHKVAEKYLKKKKIFLVHLILDLLYFKSLLQSNFHQKYLPLLISSLIAKIKIKNQNQITHLHLLKEACPEHFHNFDISHLTVSFTGWILLTI